MNRKRTIFFKWLIFVIILNLPSYAQLRNISNQADYIIVTPSCFVKTLQPFAKWRESKFITVKTVTLDQILNEFPDTLTVAQSIRDFLSYAYSYWQSPKPRYVLLAGGVDYIPSIRVRSFLAIDPQFLEDSVSIDEWYSVNNNEENTCPDFALGRFPVKSSAELKNIIDKTIFLEDSVKIYWYKYKCVVLTDITDSLSFIQRAEDFVESTVPSSYSYLEIYSSAYPSVEATRKVLFDAMDAGSLFISYYGHGAPHIWSKYGILKYSDIDSMNRSALPSVYTSVSCSQNFDDSGDSCLVRNLLSVPHSGAAAILASSGVNMLDIGSNFLKEFYHYLMGNTKLTVGEAFLLTKKYFNYKNMSEDDFIRRFTFLGDPALKLPFGMVTASEAHGNENIGSFAVEQNYPNPFNPSTVISYRLPAGGHVSLKVYDILGNEVAVLVDKIQAAGSYSVSFSTTRRDIRTPPASGVYIYRLTAGDYSAARKMILLK